MSRGLVWFIGVIATLLVAVILLLVLVRSADGPMEILSGGPFRTGEVVSNITDWTFMDEHMAIEMQTMLPPRSRTMWLIVHDNRPYVISSYMNSKLGRLWKQWPRTIEKDNRAIIRLDGKLYELALTRVSVTSETEAILGRFNEKYKTRFTLADIESGSSWLFELSPR